MDKDTILSRLQELGRRLANDKIEAEITIFGGAAMALMHDERRTTDDIDASFSHSTDIQLIIFNMRDEYDFKNNWLNSAGDFIISDDTPRIELTKFPGLTIKIVAPDFLLASKIKASREKSKDYSDTKFLIEKLGITTKDEVLAITRKYFPRLEIEEKHELNLSNAFGKADLVPPTPPKPSGKPRRPKP